MARTAIYMPKYGMTMTEALLVSWWRKEGESIEQGDPLFAIETEKANTDVEAPASGFLVDIKYAEGDTVEVGEILGYIADSLEESALPLPTEPAVPLHAAAHSVVPVREGETSAGPQALAGLRKEIAVNMMRSLHQTAQLTLLRDLAVDRLAKFKESQPGISYNDLLVKAAALAARGFPAVLSQLVDGKLYRAEDVHIGLAVALDEGLVVPVIQNADRLSLDEISQERKRLVEKARQGQLDLKEIAGNVCTISNLGTYGIDAFTPILNPPETVILGIGRILPRPWVENGQLVARQVLHLSITFDHQVLDGASAAQFLDLFCSLLDDPQKLAGV